jgi:HKD family nuclease
MRAGQELQKYLALMEPKVRVCSSPAASLKALEDLCSWGSELRLTYAWATSNEGRAAHWKVLPLDKVKQATVGIQFAQTEPAALRALLACGPGVLKVVEDTGGVFHPKVIVALRGAEARALIGSSNFTHGGFSGNTELNVLVEGPAAVAPLDEVLAFVGQQWTHPRAFVPSEEWLTRYERAYEKRPSLKPLPKHDRAEERLLVHTETDLDISWDDYYALIEQQERRSLSNGFEIHVFDHSQGSYLQEVERCQELFRAHSRFEEMPLEDRKFVAGFGETSGYFGRMGGAGNYKNMIIQRPGEIGPILDAIPSKGRPTDDQVVDYVDAASRIQGVSLATATRLLVAKRPDLFLSVNRASRDRIREVFGTAPNGAARYLALLHRIWLMPWFTAPEPDNEHGRRVWRVRVAILDAVLYDAL